MSEAELLEKLFELAAKAGEGAADIVVIYISVVHLVPALLWFAGLMTAVVFVFKIFVGILSDNADAAALRRIGIAQGKTIASYMDEGQRESIVAQAIEDAMK